jgi:hypothetical protein
MYTTPLHYIIAQHKLSSHYYADDTQIYLSCEPTDLARAKERLEACLQDLLYWLLCNNLALNSSKTEVLLFGTKQQLAKVATAISVHIGNGVINIIYQHCA